MPESEYFSQTISLDEETLAMLKNLSKESERNVSAYVRWLIKREWERQFSQPQPLITVEDAINAKNLINSSGSLESAGA